MRRDATWRDRLYPFAEMGDVDETGWQAVTDKDFDLARVIDGL